ncbi:MAG: hypothetical protein RSC44_03810, partial [Clostridia bacterium]
MDKLENSKTDKINSTTLGDADDIVVFDSVQNLEKSSKKNSKNTNANENKTSNCDKLCLKVDKDNNISKIIDKDNNISKII